MDKQENLKILIIDDEIEICLNMKEMLGYEDFNADYVTTAKEAFQKMSENEYGLLLVDIKLEGRVSGLDIIKSFSGKERRPKIIVISAISRDSLEEVFPKETMATFIDGYLEKPGCSDPDKLIALTRRVMG